MKNHLCTVRMCLCAAHWGQMRCSETFMHVVASAIHKSLLCLCAVGIRLIYFPPTQVAGTETLSANWTLTPEIREEDSLNVPQWNALVTDGMNVYINKHERLQSKTDETDWTASERHLRKISRLLSSHLLQNHNCSYCGDSLSSHCFDCA